MAKLYIIAGHGAGDPGATGGGQTEAETVRTLAHRIKALGGDEVELLDMSRNWYADNGISQLSLPKDSKLVELHRDSGSSSARGAHIIIHGSLNADTFDTALASNLAAILPGRSNIIVKRTDLANPNRAKARGISYCLAEIGFISNDTDRDIFNNRMDEIALAILKAAGISIQSREEPAMLTPGGTHVYRMYNEASGDHFYTSGKAEHDSLLKAGWTDEGGFDAAEATPVWRLYNPNAKAGEDTHFYTADVNERNALKDTGWKYEGTAFYSVPNGRPVYRLFDGKRHHWTDDTNEKNTLQKSGWKYEGIAWNVTRD